MSRISQTDLEAVFAARGWLSEHPAAFRALLFRQGVIVEAHTGACVFRRDDASDGLYGILSGAIGVEGGHRRQSPLLAMSSGAANGSGSRACCTADRAN